MRGRAGQAVQPTQAIRFGSLDDRFVPDKLERVARFHEHTLEALKELVQAAGLQHPNDITASHIMRRSAGQGVRPLSSELSFVAPGALLQAAEGRCPWPAEVFATHWPRARSDSFAAA